MRWQFDPAAITKIRQGVGLSQAEFARRIGVSRQVLALIERGRRPTVRTLEAIMEEFGAGPGIFFREDGLPKRQVA